MTNKPIEFNAVVLENTSRNGSVYPIEVLQKALKEYMEKHDDVPVFFGEEQVGVSHVIPTADTLIFDVKLRESSWANEVNANGSISLKPRCVTDGKTIKPLSFDVVVSVGVDTTGGCSDAEIDWAVGQFGIIPSTHDERSIVDAKRKETE